MRFKHGEGTTRLYRVWSAMRDRCNNPKCKDYKYYGAKGVRISPEWNEFLDFKKWAFENGYNENAKCGECTIDRINCDGDYEPNNCRWVDRSVQANNTSSNRNLTYNGETHNVEQWSVLTNIPPKTIRARLDKGWSVERALTNSTTDHRIAYFINGEKRYLKDLAKEYDINYHTLYNRLFNYGWSIERALSE